MFIEVTSWEDKKKMLLNTEKITYLKEETRGKTEVRYMTYRLELAYSELPLEELAALLNGKKAKKKEVEA